MACRDGGPTQDPWERDAALRCFQKANSRRILLSGPHSQPHTDSLLEHLENREEVGRIGIATWPEHAMEALAWFLKVGGQLLEADGRVDDVAQDRFSRDLVATKISVHRFRQQRSAECAILLCAFVD